MAAKAYRARHDVTLNRIISRVEGEGENAQFATQGTNYPAGSFIKADTMMPFDRKRAEDGHLDHALEPVPDDVADRIGDDYGDPEPEFGIFAAEHEAEAHALESYGHHVLPREQEMELLSSSADYHRRYQERAREIGMDERPNLAPWNPENRERVPDEMLRGGQQRTGAPHNRGPEVPDEDENSSDEGEEREESASRPAPGGGHRQEADAQTVNQE